MAKKERYKEEIFQDYKLIGYFKEQIDEVHDYWVYLVEVKKEPKNDILFNEETYIDYPVSTNKASELIKSNKNLHIVENCQFALQVYTFSKAKEKIELKKFENRGTVIPYNIRVEDWLYDVRKMLSKKVKK